jgi:hypothetical protein
MIKKMNEILFYTIPPIKGAEGKQKNYRDFSVKQFSGYPVKQKKSMQKRQLGRSEIKVAPLMLGRQCVRLDIG